MPVVYNMHGRGISGMFLGYGGQGNGPTGQPTGAGIPVCTTRRHCRPMHSPGGCWPPKHDIVPRQPVNDIQAQHNTTPG